MRRARHHIIAKCNSLVLQLRSEFFQKKGKGIFKFVVTKDLAIIIAQ